MATRWVQRRSHLGGAAPHVRVDHDGGQPLAARLQGSLAATCSDQQPHSELPGTRPSAAEGAPRSQPMEYIGGGCHGQRPAMQLAASGRSHRALLAPIPRGRSLQIDPVQLFEAVDALSALGACTWGGG